MRSSHRCDPAGSHHRLIKILAPTPLPSPASFSVGTARCYLMKSLMPDWMCSTTGTGRTALAERLRCYWPGPQQRHEIEVLKSQLFITTAKVAQFRVSFPASLYTGRVGSSVVRCIRSEGVDGSGTVTELSLPLHCLTY